MTQSSALSLHLHSSAGVGQLRVPITHPLVAAFRRGIEEGQLTGTWRFLLTCDAEDAPWLVVGTFVLTPGGRFLYFPGAEVAVDARDEEAPFVGYTIDHLTLDRPTHEGHYRSHIAVRGQPLDQSRGIDYRAPSSAGFLLPWFSLLLPSTQGFATFPEHLYVEFPAPRTDLATYGEHLMANGGVVSLPLPSQSAGTRYIQFDVWAGHGDDWQVRSAQLLAWANKPEIVTDAPPTQDVPIHTVDAQFSGGTGLRFLASQPQGRLSSVRVVRPRLKPRGAA